MMHNGIKLYVNEKIISAKDATNLSQMDADSTKKESINTSVDTTSSGKERTQNSDTTSKTVNVYVYNATTKFITEQKKYD